MTNATYTVRYCSYKDDDCVATNNVYVCKQNLCNSEPISTLQPQLRVVLLSSLVATVFILYVNGARTTSTVEVEEMCVRVCVFRK